MKIPIYPLLPSLVMVCLSLTGCNRYQVTLNERTIHTPPTLYTDYSLADAGLEACVTQTIKDRSITSPDQLQQLNCSDGAIASLEGLQLFSQINTLNLANNNLQDVSLLIFMGKLQAINLAGNPKLECKDAITLKSQLPGEVILPDHCG